MTKNRSLIPALLLGGLVGALAVITYIFWIGNYLVADDWTLISSASQPNWGLGDFLPFGPIMHPTSSTNYYAPVLSAVLWLSFKLGGYSPERYHLLLIAFHAGTSIALYLSVLQWTGSQLKATAAGAIFAVHFASTEAVGWFAGWTHPIAGFAGALSLLYYTRYLVIGRPRWAIAALAAAVGRVLTQSTGLPWFAVLACLDILYFATTGKRHHLGRRLAVLAGFLVASAALEFPTEQLARGGYRPSLGPWTLLNLFYYPISTMVPSFEGGAYSFFRDLLAASSDPTAVTRLLSTGDAFNILLAASLVIVATVLLWRAGGWLGRFAVLGFLLSMSPFLLMNGQGYRCMYTPLLFFSLAVANTAGDLYARLRSSSLLAAGAVLAMVPLFVGLSFAESQRQMFWWKQAGFVAQRSLQQLQELEPRFPVGSTVVIGGVPDTLPGTNAEIWRQGLPEALRAVYGDPGLKIDTYFNKDKMERLFQGDLGKGPNTYGFVWEWGDWQFRRFP